MATEVKIKPYDILTNEEREAAVEAQKKVNDTSKIEKLVYDIQNSQVNQPCHIDGTLENYQGQVVEVIFRKNITQPDDYTGDRFHLFYKMEDCINIMDILYSGKAKFRKINKNDFDIFINND